MRPVEVVVLDVELTFYIAALVVVCDYFLFGRIPVVGQNCSDNVLFSEEKVALRVVSFSSLNNKAVVSVLKEGRERNRGNLATFIVQLDFTSRGDCLQLCHQVAVSDGADIEFITVTCNNIDDVFAVTACVHS